MLRALLLLAVASLAGAGASPVEAAVHGTLHINSGYSDVTNGLVPDIDLNTHGAVGSGQHVVNGGHGCLLHQPDHLRRSQHGHVPTA